MDPSPYFYRNKIRNDQTIKAISVQVVVYEDINSSLKYKRGYHVTLDLICWLQTYGTTSYVVSLGWAFWFNLLNQFGSVNWFRTTLTSIFSSPFIVISFYSISSSCYSLLFLKIEVIRTCTGGEEKKRKQLGRIRLQSHQNHTIRLKE